ncbi:MAG: ARMT1-like domain-containing protein [Thermoplasmata archaeon]|nr:ARMT1-like domain-containing protein [Thermoplasmata archaeon]
MKLTTTCVPCLLRRVGYEVDLGRPERTMRALRECSEIMGKTASNKISSAEFASVVHRRAYSIMGIKDPYSALKRKSNEIALRLLPEAERYVEASEYPLRAAMKVSIIGNLLDFGIAGSLVSPQALTKKFKIMLDEPLGWDDSKEIQRIIRKTDEVLFLADNCGEIVFDRILIEIIKEIGCSVELVVKGEPILTDVTKRDLKGLGIERMVDEILETEGIAIGLNLWDKDVNRNLKKRMKSARLLISKGMANFEALSEYEWNAVAYLLRSKCQPIADALKVEIDTNIIKLVTGKIG